METAEYLRILKDEIRNIGNKKLEEVFTQNPYMAEIYPSMESRKVLEVFQMYEGEGEFFDLSVKPIYRASFYLGKNSSIRIENGGFYVTESCQICGKCFEACPQNCMELLEGKAWINQEHCLHCGRCYEICPQKAILKRG